MSSKFVPVRALQAALSAPGKPAEAGDKSKTMTTEWNWIDVWFKTRWSSVLGPTRESTSVCEVMS